MDAERCNGSTTRGRTCRIRTTYREGNSPMCHHHGGKPNTELWQVYLGLWDNEIEDMEPVTDLGEAQEALRSLGVEYTAIEEDPDSEGTYLVGLTGRYRTLARRGEVWEENRDYQIHVPQP